MTLSDSSESPSRMTADQAIAAAKQLATVHDVPIVKVLSVRYVSLKDRLAFEPAAGGLWVVMLAERSPLGEHDLSETCIVNVEESTGTAAFELTL